MATGKRRVKPVEDKLLNRLQALLYAFEAMGRFDEAKPHILGLMKIAREAAEETGPVSRRA